MAQSVQTQRAGKPVTRADLEALHGEAWRWSLACCRGDREIAMDALHDSYVAALEGRARFNGAPSLKTWFFGIVRNMARSARRRASFRAAFFTPLERAPDIAAEAEPDRISRSKSFAEAMAGLSPRQRQIAELVFLQDMSLSEAALVLGVSVGAARTQYARAKDKLRARLNGGGDPL